MGQKEEWKLGQKILEKQVRPVILAKPAHLEQLRQDLRNVGCEEFLYVPWDIHDEPVLEELAGGKVVAE
jgi:hypothetical protein